MIDHEEELWLDRCLDRAMELDEADMEHNDRVVREQSQLDDDPDAYYAHQDYLKRKAIRDAETPEQRKKREARERLAGEREMRNQEMGVTCLGDILGAALAKKAGK